jgi:hypothetical protein
MLKEALAVVAGAAAVAAPGGSADQALARRLLVTAGDVPGVVAAARSSGLSPCSVPQHHRTAAAFGRFLFFGRSEIVSAATVYSTATEARAAATGSVKRLASPCLARALSIAYEQQGARFAAGTTEVKRLVRYATRVRLNFVLRDRKRKTGEGVYDVVMLQRGRAVAGVAFVNPIDEAWERGIVEKVAARLP